MHVVLQTCQKITFCFLYLPRIPLFHLFCYYHSFFSSLLLLFCILAFALSISRFLNTKETILMMINVAIVNVRALGPRLLVRADIMNAGFTEAFLVVRMPLPLPLKSGFYTYYYFPLEFRTHPTHSPSWILWVLWKSFWKRWLTTVAKC
jgi:hypothetical protein